ncbi:FixJ family two-component response regulator [Rhodoblastus acidophilus]|uniref:response regulator transcription factor n=1 Tax=Rhodoblastus acidophilus TaxID=1074 RepID=UPI001608F3CA|nr:response regulator [Rhodoblastus acidophilus]MCW2286252.1 FixJ family two-component response regulator [Rhodoblastus acidophilus]MCW2335168.1 FixJ family two-component response regulator [Rhodoblastus acidophilus]
MQAICVIDDDVLIRIGLEMALKKEGFDVRAFSSGCEFLEEGDFSEIGCIVTDIEMPGGVTGLDLLAETRKTAPDCPVVVMTGKGEGAFRSAALALGARAYIEKPASPRKILDAIAGAMRPAVLAA